ncbi:flavodoxin [Brevundimonas sp.]|uniref:flavodoxin n=1 Tax=Brevundimonas sp. TaxID=1871086 RepID=UPI0035677D81
MSAPVAMALMAGSTTACAQETQPAAGPTSNILVAYFTRSGNTRVIAGQLKRTLDADLFEILPAEPYPEDYQANVDQARRERDAGFEPPLKAEVQNLAAYDTVYLGFPIWGETAPPVIRSFMRRHNLAGKTVRPFITHGGYGQGSSLSVLASHAPGARIQDAFVMEADQERRTITLITEWLGSDAGAQANR